MAENQTVTVEDMSDLFRFFRIPKDLYQRWSRYASAQNITMKTALADLLYYARQSGASQFEFRECYQLHSYPDIMERMVKKDPKKRNNSVHAEIYTRAKTRSV